MNYVITAKNIHNGSTVTDPLARTELCTELIITRLKLIEMLNTGQIDSSASIVTRRDRACFYENIFTNVLDYNTFENAKMYKEAGPSGTVIDLVKDIYLLCETLPYKPFYQRFEQDKEQIFNIALNSLADPNSELVNQPFICILNRQMPNHPEKNISTLFWLDFITSFTNDIWRFRRGLPYVVYIFGEVDVIAKEQKYHRVGSQRIPDLSIKYVQDVKSWCSLLANPLCKCVLAPATGGVYPIFFTGHDNSKLLIIDQNKLIEQHGHDPSFYNECINFKKVKVAHLNYIPTFSGLVETVIDYAAL